MLGNMHCSPEQTYKSSNIAASAKLSAFSGCAISKEGWSCFFGAGFSFSLKAFSVGQNQQSKTCIGRRYFWPCGCCCNYFGHHLLWIWQKPQYLKVLTSWLKHLWYTSADVADLYKILRKIKEGQDLPISCSLRSKCHCNSKQCGKVPKSMWS